MKENYGDLEKLSLLESEFKNDFTIEQLLNENLKNEKGESNLEVRKRMLTVFSDIVNSHKGKNIVIISHGAGIKYFLQNWCKYDNENDCMIYNNKILCPRKIKYTGVIKFEIIADSVCNIEYLN